MPLIPNFSEIFGFLRSPALALSGTSAFVLTPAGAFA